MLLCGWHSGAARGPLTLLRCLSCSPASCAAAPAHPRLRLAPAPPALPCQDIEHRRPYESLLLCWPAHLPPPGPPGSGSAAPGLPDAAVQRTPAAAAAIGEAAGSWQLRQPSARVTAGFHLLPGRELVIAAVPPAEHSRKPHLGGLLLPLLPPGARCLEVFKADALPAPMHMLACTPQAPRGWIASSAVAAALQRPQPACRTFPPPCAGA